MLRHYAGSLLCFLLCVSGAQPNPLLERGEDLYRQQRWGEAAEVFEQALRSTNDSLAHFMLAESLWKLGRSDERAMRHMRLAISTDPTSLTAEKARERIREMERGAKMKQGAVERARASVGKEFVGKARFPSGAENTFCFYIPTSPDRTIDFTRFPARGEVVLLELSNRTGAAGLKDYAKATAWLMPSRLRIEITLSPPKDDYMKYGFLDQINIDDRKVSATTRLGVLPLDLIEDTRGVCRLKP